MGGGAAASFGRCLILLIIHSPVWRVFLSSSPCATFGHRVTLAVRPPWDGQGYGSMGHSASRSHPPQAPRLCPLCEPEVPLSP